MRLFLLCVTSLQISHLQSQEEKPLSFHASYIGDIVNNMHGGLRTGITYLGFASVKMDVNTEAAGWWKGGTCTLNIGNTHGGMPSANLVGDFLGVSSIEAGNLTFLYELWYRQQVGSFAFTVGVQDLNVDFASSIHGNLFNNSSFGIHSNITDNIPAPTFPLTALGMSIDWDINNKNDLKAAVFDGTPDNYEKNPYNLKWRLNKYDGYLTIVEWKNTSSLLKKMEGSYKFGVYFHSHDKNDDNLENNGGIYFIADQQICKWGNHQLGLFSQTGFSLAKNHNNYYISQGINYSAPFSSRPNDACGIAVAYAGIHDNNGIGDEWCIEAVYKYQVNKHIYLKPDLQYVISPAGTDQNLKNAMVGIVRVGIEI